MARSQRLRLGEVKKVFKLVQECRELGADWELWGRHLLAGWTALLEGQVASLRRVGPRESRKSQPFELVQHAAHGSSVRPAVVQLSSEEQDAHDFALARLIELGLPHAVRSMAQLCDCQALDAADRFSPLAEAEFDKVLLGLCNAPDLTLLLTLRRADDAPRFESRDCRLTGLLQKQLVPLLGVALALPGAPGMSSLSARQRQTLLCILEGGGEKQVAQQLGLSKATVHQYIGQLYRHFGVNDRAELLAFFLRRSGMVARLRQMSPADAE